ncbi:MAG: DUF4070 domain-containing protein [Anaerolineae bacterium]|nr:DUF4070 domain-containing protein [Anaerolineae bacterium]
MKILFVYPEFPDTFWSFKHALKFIQKKAGSPPLGLLTVAAMLPSEWEKQLVDLNLIDLTDEDLAIHGVESTQYWRLLFWTLFRRPRLFPLAITFAIYGFHFRQVIELHVS